MTTQSSDQEVEWQSYTLLSTTIRAVTQPKHNKPNRDYKHLEQEITKS